MSEGRPPRPAVKAVLVVCLAVAIFLGGFVVGHFATFRLMAPEDGRPTPERMLERLVHRLPPADADLVRAAFRADESKLSQLMSELQASERGIHSALTAQPFDKAAFEAALQVTRAKRDALAAEIQSVILGIVDKLSPEGRAKMWRPAGH